MSKRRAFRHTQTPNSQKPKPTCKGKVSRDPESHYGTAFRWFPDAFFAALGDPYLMDDLVEELTETTEPLDNLVKELPETKVPRGPKRKAGQAHKMRNRRCRSAVRKKRKERRKLRDSRFLKQAIRNAETHLKKTKK